MAIRKYPIPDVGQTFNELKVNRVHRMNGIVKIDLICSCGTMVLNKSLGHLYDTSNRKAVRRCHKCAMKENGKNSRISGVGTIAL